MATAEGRPMASPEGRPMATPEGRPQDREVPVGPGEAPAGSCEGQPSCCPLYHEAVELIGRRWTGAIVGVLIQGSAMRFGQIAAAVPALSDRLLSERMKELEARGLVQRTVCDCRPIRVEYRLTDMGRELGPAVREIERWAQRWLAAQRQAS